MTTEFGWLIETGDHKYWNGRHASQDGFVHDANDAVRFARFEDGERVIHWLMREYSVFLVTRQHAFIDGDAQAHKDQRPLHTYTGPARDGIEAQHGLNDVFPGDPMPPGDGAANDLQ